MKVLVKNIELVVLLLIIIFMFMILVIGYEDKIEVLEKENNALEQQIKRTEIYNSCKYYYDVDGYYTIDLTIDEIINSNYINVSTPKDSSIIKLSSDIVSNMIVGNKYQVVLKNVDNIEDTADLQEIIDSCELVSIKLKE